MSNLALKQHQLEAGRYLADKARGLLTDPPGMMKTLSVIHGLALAGVERPLIVCPAIVRSHWQRSIVEYTENFAAEFSVNSTVIKSYDEIVRGGEALKDMLLASRDSIHLDEFHFLKHATAQRTQMLLGKEGYVRALPDLAWGTSGSPLDKNPTNIWTILSTFFPELAVEYQVPTFKKFVERFGVWELRTRHGKRYPHYFPEVREPEVFAEMLSRMWLRRESLPGVETLWQTLLLDGTSHVHLDYTTDSPLLAEALQSAESIAELKLIATDPEVARARRRLGEHKVVPVTALVTDEMENTDEKIVLFAYHRSVLGGLRDALAPYGVAYIDGDTSPSKRDEAVDKFINDPHTRIFIGQNQACGTGMDGLQKSGARRMLLVEPEWSDVLNHQLAARLARHGQQHATVAVQMVALAGTLDEGIVRLTQREAELLQEVGL